MPERLTVERACTSYFRTEHGLPAFQGDIANWRAAVELALRRVAIEPMTKQEVLAMQGVGWQGDLDQMRSGDPGDVW